MAQDKRVFTGGMDKDSEPRLIKQGDYRDAKNIRNIASSDGTSGSVENIEGTNETNYNFIDESETIVEVINDQVVTVTQNFEYKDIIFSGKEVYNATYSFAPLNVNASGSLFPLFSNLPSGNLGWAGLNGALGTSAYLHSRFNPDNGTLSQNIPLLATNSVSGETTPILGRSELYVIHGSSINAYNAGVLTEMNGTEPLDGSRLFILRIISNVPDVSFELDFSHSNLTIGASGELGSGGIAPTYWSNTLDENLTYGSLDIMAPGNQVVLGSASGIQEELSEITVDGDLVSSTAENDDGSPIGDINVFSGNSNITEVQMTISGFNPTSAQDPLNEFKMFSVAQNEDGSIQAIPFAVDQFGLFESDFNSGDPFEFDGDQTEIAASLIDKLSVPFSTQIIVPSGSSSVTHTISTANQNVATDFSANTVLGVARSSNLSAEASASDFLVVESYDSLSSFNYGRFNSNFIDSNPSVAILNDSITIANPSRGGAFNREIFFPVPSTGIVKGETYRIEANISTFSSSGNSITFQTQDGNNISPAVTSTDSSFSFQFEAVENNQLFKLVIANDFAEQDTIVMSGVSIRQYQNPVGSLIVEFRASHNFDLVFGTDVATVIDQYEQGTSIRDLEWFSGVNVNLLQTIQYGEVYDNIIAGNQDYLDQIEELDNTIASLQDQLNSLTTEYNATITSLNDALALDSSEAIGSYNLINGSASNLAEAIAANDESLAVLFDTLGSNQDQVDDAFASGEAQGIASAAAELAALQIELDEALDNLENATATVVNAVGQNLITNGDFTSVGSLLNGSLGWRLYDGDNSFGAAQATGEDISIQDPGNGNGFLRLRRELDAIVDEITSVAAWNTTENSSEITESSKIYRLQFDVVSSTTVAGYPSTSLLQYYDGSGWVDVGSVSGLHDTNKVIFYEATGTIFAIRLRINDRILDLDNFSLQEISTDTLDDFYELENNLSTAQETLLEIEEAIALDTDVLVEANPGVTVENLINAYNEASGSVSGLTTEISGLIALLNNASFSNADVDASVNDQITELETAIQTIVNLDESIGGDQGFVNISEFQNAITNLQSSSGELIDLHADLQAIANNILDFIPSDMDYTSVPIDAESGEVVGIYNVSGLSDQTYYTMYQTVLEQIVNQYGTILLNANSISNENSSLNSQLIHDAEQAVSNLADQQEIFDGLLADAESDAVDAYNLQVAAETALANAEAAHADETAANAAAHAAEVGNLQTTIDENAITIVANNDEISDLQDQLAASYGIDEINNLNNQIDDLTNQNTALQDNNNALTAQISSINASLDSLSADLSQAVIDLNAANDALIAADPDLATAADNVASLTAIANGLEIDLQAALDNAEDGVSQADLDAAVAVVQDSLNTANEALNFLTGQNPLTNLATNSTFDDESNISPPHGTSVEGGVFSFSTNAMRVFRIPLENNSWVPGEYIFSCQLTSTTSVPIAIQNTEDYVPVGVNMSNPNISTTDGTLIYRITNTHLDEEGIGNARITFSLPVDSVGTLDNVYLFKVPDNLNLSDEAIGAISGDFENMQSQLVSSIVGLSNSASEDDLLFAYESGYSDGAASVTPEDGIGQADVDASYSVGYAAGAASVTPEDGISQTDLDAVQNLSNLISSNFLIEVGELTSNIVSLLGMLYNLSSSVESFSAGSLSAALGNLSLISTTNDTVVADFNEQYATDSQELNDIITAIQEQLLLVEEANAQGDGNVYNEYSFVLYGYSVFQNSHTFDFFNEGRAVQLIYLNDNLPGYEGHIDLVPDNGNNIAAGVLGSCHLFDNSPQSHNQDGTYGSLGPHDHIKVIGSGTENVTILKLSIKNFGSSSVLSTASSPLITENYEFFDGSESLIDRGLHFTISVLAGDPNWQFHTANDDGTNSQALDPDGSLTHVNLYNESLAIPATSSSSATNNITNTGSEEDFSSGQAGFTGTDAWNFVSAEDHWAHGETVIGPTDVLQKTPNLTLQAGTTYEVTFQCWCHFASNNENTARAFSVDLGDNSLGSTHANTASSVLYNNENPNEAIYEERYRRWEAFPGENVAVINDFSTPPGYANQYHKVVITTGDSYTANVLRIYGSPTSGSDESVSGGFTGWISNISINEIQLISAGTSTVNANLLYERTATAVENARSRYSNPLYNRSRILNGSAKRMIKDKVTGITKEIPIVADGYKCIGVYEDKPKNKIYYFVENKILNNKKYDCILEYDLMSDSVETVYQDGRVSSDGSNNRILNFYDSNLITGVSKIDDILYWTDNVRLSSTVYNRPRKINVELAKANEKNINSPRFVFKDAYIRSSVSTVYIGIGSNDHVLSAGDDIYAQLGLTSGAAATGINGYSRVIGVVRKPNVGTEFIVTNSSATVTTNIDHGLDDYQGDWIGIEDSANNNFPYYYQISTIVGNTITLTSPYNQATNSNGASPVTFGGKLAVGIITDSPWPGNFTPVDGVILYADPYSDNRLADAYSPLISFGTTEDKMKYFDVVKHQPTHKPSISINTDTSFAANNILDNVFQFKYRYVHVDNEQTSYSPISDIAIDPIFALNSAVDAEDYAAIANKIVVDYDDSIGDVKDIEIVARKGNNGEFVLVDNVTNNFVKYLKKAKNKYLPEYQYTDINSAINFYNNGTYPFVDKKDSDKLYDAVPKVAKAQTVLSNNRIAYGNIIEGFDNTNIVANSSYDNPEGSTLTSSSVALQTSAESGQGGFTDLQSSPAELFNNNLGGGDGKTEHTQAWYLGGLDLSSGKTQTVYINYSWKYQKQTDLSLVGTQKRNGSFSLPGVDVTGIETINELGNFLAQTINAGNGTTNLSTDDGDCNHTTSAEFDPSYSGVPLLKITFKYDHENPFSMAGTWDNLDGDKDKWQPTNESVFLSGDPGLSSFKTGAFHNFGIAYFDETNRCSFVNTAADYSNVTAVGGVPLNGTRPYNPFFTESAGPALNTPSQVTLNIYNQPPTWATHYQVYYTGNTTIDNDPDSDFPGFIQMMFVGAKVATDSNDKQIYLNLGALKGKDWSYNQANNSKLNYNYVAGDRIRFISFESNNSRFKYSEYIDLEIAGMDLYLQNEEPPIDVNGDTEGFYLRINDPGETAAQFGNAAQTINIAHSGFSYASSGYNKLVAEIYRPKKDLDEDLMVYYEIGDKIPILSAGFLTRRHGGDSSQGSDFTYNKEIGERISDIPATINISNGDVYFKPRGMATTDTGSLQEVFFPEDYYLNDFHRTNHYSKGRINVVNNNAAERRLDTTVYYSETYSSTGSVNGLSSFNPANSPYFDYNKSFGSIQSLQMRDNDLLIFHENKVGRVLVQKDILNTASGEGLVSLSTNVIGNYVSLYQGEYGCCLQPESIVSFGNIFYFIDIKKGAALRLSADGLTVISDSGMRDYFRDLGEMYTIHDPEQTENQVFNIVAGYDPKYDEYIVTFPNVYTDRGEGLWGGDRGFWNSSIDKYQNKRVNLIYSNQTIAFNEKVNRWTSFYEFYPEYYARIGRQFIGFKEGRLYRHNMTDRHYQDIYALSEDHYLNKVNKKYNSFYGEQFDSHIEFPFNAEPSSVKSFNAISLESDSKLFASMYTNIGQVVQGSRLSDGYKNVISTDIGYKKVDGTVSKYESETSGNNVIQGFGVNFFEQVKKGDLVKIFGLDKNNIYTFIHRIVISVVSNSLIVLNEDINITVEGNHMETLDYKTKEGVHYANIPFVESMINTSGDELSGYGDYSEVGDGSEISGIGPITGITSAGGSVLKEYSGFFTADSNSISYKITPNNMIVGAEYVLTDQSNYFNVGLVNNNFVYNAFSPTGTVFVCQKPTSIDTGKVTSTDFKLYVRRLDNTVVFLGYPYYLSSGSISFVADLNYSQPDDQEAGGFLFVVKNGRVEGEKMKGQYMMTTLTTEHPGPAVLSKYKFNLYAANADVDKSELSNK